MGRRYCAAFAKLTACVAISLEHLASTLSRKRGRFKIAMALQPRRQTLIMDQRESITDRGRCGAKCLGIGGAAALCCEGLKTTSPRPHVTPELAALLFLALYSFS